MLDTIKPFIPLLSNALRKGDMGRLAVVGGSKEYTGAPYFAAISALNCGADLVHVICAESAAPVIKSYSPDLIVHPDLDQNLQEAKRWIDRSHAALIGPGLGLGGNLNNATELMVHCLQQTKPLVVDADGLFIVNQNLDLIRNQPLVILTPNVIEFQRLFKTVLGREPSGSHTSETELLSRQLGNVTILRKGPIDAISNGENTVLCEENGAPRRCGGQGDLLSGTTLTFFNWFHKAQTSDGQSLPFPVGIGAALAGCTLTRRCGNLAFAKYGRSMLTAHMLPEIQHSFEQLFGV